MFTLSNAFYPYIGGPGLSVSIDAGFLFNASGGATLIPAQTISLAANSTTYVFMNLSAVLVQSNTSGFPAAGSIPIAIVTTNNSGVVRITDMRPDFGGAGSIAGSSVSVNGTAVANPNFNATTPTAPGGDTNVVWQFDGSGNVSAYAQAATPASPTNSVQFNNAGAFGGSSNLVWDNTNVDLTIGTAPATVDTLGVLNIDLASSPTASVGLLIEDEFGFSTAAFISHNSISANNPAVLNFYRTRGTGASPTATLLGDWLGAFTFIGYSTSYHYGAEIAAATTQDWTSGFLGTNIIFNTVPQGTTALAEAFRIGTSVGSNSSSLNLAAISTQVIGFLGSTTPSAALDTGFSRVSAAVVALGNGTAGDFSGTLKTTVVNAVTGFQVNGSAPLNHFLVGNGTDYVDSASIPTGTVLWNQIGNASGALTLANGANATTFNQTSAVNWTWANTTAATSGTSQSSPILNLNGTYWTGAASATDSWTVQNVIANGTNGASTLSVVHAGSTGTKTFAVGTPGALTTSYNFTLCGSTLDSVMTQTGGFSHNVGSSAAWTLQGTNQVFAFEGQGNSGSTGTGIVMAPQAGLLTIHGLGFWSSQTGNTIDVAAQGATDGNSIHLGGGGYVNLFTYVNSGQLYTGSLSLNQIGFGVLTNLAPTLATGGTAGSTTWGYQLVGIDANGQVANVSSQVTIATGNANLTSSNFITITAPTPNTNGISMCFAGIMRWDVYRVTVGTSPTSTGRIGQIARSIPGQNTLTLRDTGLVGDGNAVPTVNVSGSLFAPGNIQTSGSLTIKTPTQVQTQVETDNFTRANENPLSDGGNWTAMGGYVTGQIVSNLAQPTATNTNAVALWTGGGLPSPDQYSEITINTLVASGDIVGPVVRGSLGVATSNTTCYRGTVNGPLGATARLSIQKFVNGNQSDMTGLQTATINSGDKVRLAAVGTLLTLYINGVAVATTNDSTISGGYPGIWMFAPTGGNTSDAALSAFFGGTNTQATEYVVDNTGKVKTYNAETTAGVGTSYLRGSTAQKSETGADANVLTVTPALAAGTYRINVVMSVSAANTATLGWTATWTDSNGTTQSPTNLQINTAGTAAPAQTVTASAGGVYYGKWVVDVNNSGTNIVVKTTFAGTSIAYNVSAFVERIA